jgi:hypothetical protein
MTSNLNGDNYELGGNKRVLLKDGFTSDGVKLFLFEL